MFLGDSRMMAIFLSSMFESFRGMAQIFWLACCLTLILTGAASETLLAQSASEVDTVLEQVVEGSDPMPRLIPAFYRDRSPTFIAADDMFLKDGSIDPSLFFPGDLEMIQRQLAQAPAAGCLRLDMHSSEHLPPDGTTRPISKAILESSNAVVAEVTGLSYGYQELSAGTLLRVETREVLHGDTYLDQYLIFFPVGSFEVSGYQICRTTYGFPSPPDLGDRILLLHNDVRGSVPSKYMPVLAMDVVVLPRDGVVRYSQFHGPAFEKSDSMDSNEFLDSVRALFPRLSGEADR